MMFDREFRRGLEDCLSRLSSGEDVRSCLESYPRYANRLQPYLEAASTLRGMGVPQPSAGTRQAARQRLTAAMAEATPAPASLRPAWLPAPLMRLGSVAAALALLLVAAIGGAAAFGGGDAVHDVFNALHLPSPVGGSDDDDGPEAVEFRGVVISVSQFGLALRTDDGIVSFQYTGETEFFDSQDELASWDDIARGLDAFVRAVPTDTTVFTALTVRTSGGSETPEPTSTPGPEKPESTDKPEPEPTDKPEPEEPAATPAPSKVSFEGKIKSVASESFVLLSGETTRSFEITGETETSGFLAAGVFADVTGWKRHDGTFVAATVTTYPLEFWATVVAVSGSTVTVKIHGEGPNVTLYKTGETELIGPIFAGVKVWVKAFKKAHGSYEAVRIAVKTASFSGSVSAIEGSTYTVTKEGTNYTVTTNGETEFIGTPEVGSVVTVYAYRMADGSYLAYKIKVTADVFTGVITDKNLDLNTIWVNVGGDVIEVRIDFADVIGTLEVGATVEVHVGWIEGSTYFAQLVKVIG